MFAYPYGQLGDFSLVSERVLMDAGYRVAVTTHWGTRNTWRNRMRLRRISFQETDTIDRVRAKIDGWYEWIAVKERLGHLRRRLTGVPARVAPRARN